MASQQLKCDPSAAFTMTLGADPTSNITVEEWAALWLRYHPEHLDEDFWAVNAACLLPANDPARAWSLILALVTQAEEVQLGNMGAGPLEHLIDEHAPSFIDRIESEAASDPKFKTALASTWLNSLYQSPDVVTRLVMASGGAMEPFELDDEEAEQKLLDGSDDT